MNAFQTAILILTVSMRRPRVAEACSRRWCPSQGQPFQGRRYITRPWPSVRGPCPGDLQMCTRRLTDQPPVCRIVIESPGCITGKGWPTQAKRLIQMLLWSVIGWWFWIRRLLSWLQHMILQRTYSVRPVRQPFLSCEYPPPHILSGIHGRTYNHLWSKGY